MSEFRRTRLIPSVLLTAAILCAAGCDSSIVEDVDLPANTLETATFNPIEDVGTGSTPFGEDELLLALFGPDSLPRSGDSFEIDTTDSGAFPNDQFAESTFRLDDAAETWNNVGRSEAYCIWLISRDAFPVAVQVVTEQYRDVAGAQAGVRQYASELRQTDGHAARGYEFFDLVESRLDGPWDEALAQSSGYRTGTLEAATQTVTLRIGSLVGFVRIDHPSGVTPPLAAEELADILANRMTAVRDGDATWAPVLDVE